MIILRSECIRIATIFNQATHPAQPRQRQMEDELKVCSPAPSSAFQRKPARSSSSVLGEHLAQGAHDKSCVILDLFEHKRFQGFSNSNFINRIVTSMNEFIDVWDLWNDKYWGIYNQNHNNEYFQNKGCLCSFSAWKSWQWGRCLKRRCRFKISLPSWGKGWTNCPTSLAATSSSRQGLRSSPRLEVELPHLRRSTGSSHMISTMITSISTRFRSLHRPHCPYHRRPRQALTCGWLGTGTVSSTSNPGTWLTLGHWDTGSHLGNTARQLHWSGTATSPTKRSTSKGALLLLEATYPASSMNWRPSLKWRMATRWWRWLGG